MKKLRKISLEDFDCLTSNEAANLIGSSGKDNPTVPPPSNTIPIHGSSTKPPASIGNIFGGTGVANPSGGGIVWKF